MAVLCAKVMTTSSGFFWMRLWRPCALVDAARLRTGADLFNILLENMLDVGYNGGGEGLGGDGTFVEP